MKIVKIAVALASVLAVGVLAVSAFGQDNTIWLCANKEILNAPERCLVIGENLETMKAYDLTADSEVECEAGAITHEGWVGPGSEDEITLTTFLEPTTRCKATSKALNLKEEEVTNVCEKVEKIGLLHLAWATLLTLRAGIAYDETAERGSNGEPGYEVTCKTALGNVADKCEETTESSRSPLENLVGNATEVPLVDLLYLFFPAFSDKERWKCSVGGAESGVLFGEILIEALTSTGVPLSLEVSDVNEP